MPYIEKSRRDSLNKFIDGLASRLNFDGDLNYVLYYICKFYVEPSYSNYKNYLGELEEAVAEIRRRILGEYEEQKIKANGDILE